MLSWNWPHKDQSPTPGPAQAPQGSHPVSKHFLSSGLVLLSALYVKPWEKMGPSSKPFPLIHFYLCQAEAFFSFYVENADNWWKRWRKCGHVEAGPCRRCRDGQGNLVSSTMLCFFVVFLALPSLWINVSQHCLFFQCWGCLLGCLTHSSECGWEEDPRSSTLELFIARPAWPVSGTEAQHPPLPGLGTSQWVSWGSLGGQSTHTWASSRAKKSVLTAPKAFAGKQGHLCGTQCTPPVADGVCRSRAPPRKNLSPS